jgi:hypothetical protein
MQTPSSTWMFSSFTCSNSAVVILSGFIISNSPFLLQKSSGAQNTDRHDTPFAVPFGVRYSMFLLPLLHAMEERAGRGGAFINFGVRSPALKAPIWGSMFFLPLLHRMEERDGERRCQVRFLTSQYEVRCFPDSGLRASLTLPPHSRFLISWVPD